MFNKSVADNHLAGLIRASLEMGADNAIALELSDKTCETLRALSRMPSWILISLHAGLRAIPLDTKGD